MAMADMQEINVRYSDLNPKKYIAPKRTRIKDKETVYIIRLTEITLRIWGEIDTVSFISK